MSWRVSKSALAINHSFDVEGCCSFWSISPRPGSSLLSDEFSLGEGPQSSKFCLFARSHFDWPMTTKKFETLHTLPQKIEVKEVLGSPFVRPPPLWVMQVQIWGKCENCGSSGEHVGNLGNIIGRLSEHVGKCIMGNMVPTSKSKKNWTLDPPPSLTPKGKIIIIIIIMGPLGVHVKELSHWLHENSIPKSVFVTIFWLGLVPLSSKEHDLGLM